jgi:hypothetical protein
MSDPKTKQAAKTASPKADDMTEEEATTTEAAETPVVEPAATKQSPKAEVIDLDGIRAAERQATLAYVSEVHELCALAGRGEHVAGFIAKATPVAQVRRSLLEARAAEDEATAIRGQVRSPVVEPQPAIDTQAIYAARNQNVR